MRSTPGFQKIINFLNLKLKINSPIDIAEIVEKTELSWTYVKKILEQIKKMEYIGYHFKKLGNSWIVWKKREKIIPKLNDTCSRFKND